MQTQNLDSIIKQSPRQHTPPNETQSWDDEPINTKDVKMEGCSNPIEEMETNLEEVQEITAEEQS